MKLPEIGVNQSLESTIDRDPNLSVTAKMFFHRLCADYNERTKSEAHSEFSAIAELLARNYIFIENFPAGVPSGTSNRTSRQLRLAGFKQFFTGKPE